MECGKIKTQEKKNKKNHSKKLKFWENNCVTRILITLCVFLLDKKNKKSAKKLLAKTKTNYKCVFVHDFYLFLL